VKVWYVRLLRYALPHWRGLLVVLALMLLGIGINVLQPWPLKLIVDYVLTGKPLPDVVSWIGALPGESSQAALIAWLAAGTVVLFVIRRVIAAIGGYVRTGLSSRMVYSLAG